MLIGVPKETKTHEYRVGLTPASVRELVHTHHHQVLIEHHAGAGIGFHDSDYVVAGASIADDADMVFKSADMIVKVKEPQVSECKLLREGQCLFTFLHLAPDPQQAECLMASGATAIAYETVTADDGSLPLLVPMSQVAGRMAIQAGAHCLEKAQGGNGILLGGVPGVAPAKVVVIGGGIVGTHAIRMGLGLEADVTVLDRSLPRLRQLASEFGGSLNTLYSTAENLYEQILSADLIIGAVLIPGAATPKCVRRDHLKKMRAGSVLVDVSIDQGGCFETSHPTTHAEPTYVVDGVVHYCVSNMPGAVPRTATVALNNATLPFIIELANNGIENACRANRHLRNGLNVYRGQITHPAVAEGLQCDFTQAEIALGS